MKFRTVLIVLVLLAMPFPGMSQTPEKTAAKPADTEKLNQEKEAASTPSEHKTDMAAAKKDNATTPKKEKVTPVITKVDNRRDRISISDDTNRPWVKKDPVCVFRAFRMLTCGKVIAVGVKGAVVQVNSHMASLKPGDEVRLFDPSRKTASLTDDQLFSDQIMEQKPHVFSLTMGINLSLDLIFPVANFYWSVSPVVAIGIQPAYITQTGKLDSKLTGYGGLLTVNVHSDEYFRGFWFQLGSGFYAVNATGTAGSETLNAPMVTMLFGWKEDWVNGLVIGAALGGRYLTAFSVDLSDIKYQGIYPIGLVELGFTF